MKKIVNYILVAAAAFAAFSCNKEAGIEVPASDHIVFTATLDQPTKATLDAYKVCWEAGDEIAVYNGSTWAVSAPITADDIDAGGRTATFAVDIAAASSYTLVYPAAAKSDAALPEGAAEGSVMLTLPTDQVIPAGGVIDPLALVQIATSTEPTKVSFKNATSLVEFKVPESGIDAVFVQAGNTNGSDLKIAGEGAVAPDPGTVAGSKPTIKVSGNLTAGQNYFAAVWPQAAVGKIVFGFSKGSGASVEKAGRTGTSAAGFTLPVSGGKKFEDFGALKWLTSINSKADLDYWASIADFYSAGDVVSLGADIDYQGGTWTPVSGNENSGHFAGNIDGAGHSIYNIVLGCNSEYGGFFSILASPVPTERVKDLTIGKEGDSSSLVVNSAMVSYAGALAARMKNVALSNVKNYVPVTVNDIAPGSYFGGIVGQVMSESENSISDCHNYGDVSFDCAAAGNNYYGGIVGLISGKAAISNCSNSGKISRNVASSSKGVNTFGGIAGRTGNTLAGVTIYNCANYGIVETTVNVKAGQIYYGGIIGMDGESTSETEYNLVVENCTNEGTINGYNQSTATYAATGGIIGRQSNYSLVKGCLNLGPVTKVGNHSIEACFGGIAGMTSSEVGLVQNCVNGAADDDTKGVVTDMVQTTSKNLRIGGIIGYAMRGNCEGCTNYGLVTSKSTQTKVYVGGIAGNCTICKIKYCANYGDVIVENEAADTRTAGGIIGLQNGSSNDNFTGEGCIVKCNVSSGVPGDAGLVVGRFSNSVTVCWGTSSEPVIIKSGSTVNGTSATAGNYESLLAGSSYGITASGVASGNSTIWATFQ